MLEIRSLNRDDLEGRLRYFEENHAEVFGIWLSSEDFYERFTAGDYDTPFGMTWATYYEAYARLNTSSRAPVPA